MPVKNILPEQQQRHCGEGPEDGIKEAESRSKGSLYVQQTQADRPLSEVWCRLLRESCWWLQPSPGPDLSPGLQLLPPVQGGPRKPA